MKLFCVEVGCRQGKNLCRMTTSIVVPAKTTADAIRYVEQHFPASLAQGTVQRVFEVMHVVVNWPQGDVEIAETADESTTPTI
jgi:hypothetical protein